MAKWSGKIGFHIPETEVRPGVWKPESIIEKSYRGDLLQNSRRDQSSQDSTNDNVTINNRISIVANPYAKTNFYYMKYLTYMGAKWKITSVDASQYPRMVLSIGGLYNG